jgi:DNA-binding transcriptional LysR family regulator
MDLQHCLLFRDIAHSRSVSRGAQMNGVSQSAASQYLHEIEQHLGVVLLDRSTRPLVVTTAGKLYLDLCRDVLRLNQEFEATLDRLKNDVEGTVRVASIYSVGLSELSQLEHEYLRRFPDARLEVEYLRPEKVLESVLAGRADLGLLSYPEPSRELMVLAWREEEMVVAVSPYHALAAQPAITPQDLQGLDFIGFDDDLPISRDVDRFLREHHVTVNITLHFDNLQMIKEAVAHGAGVSILPARILEAEVAQGRLARVPLTEPLFRPVGIVHRKRKRFHRAAQAFLDLLQENPVGVLAAP